MYPLFEVHGIINDTANPAEKLFPNSSRNDAFERPRPRARDLFPAGTGGTSKALNFEPRRGESLNLDGGVGGGGWSCFIYQKDNGDRESL